MLELGCASEGKQAVLSIFLQCLLIVWWALSAICSSEGKAPISVGVWIINHESGEYTPR